MSRQADMPHSEIPAAQRSAEQWPDYRHPRRKRRLFSRRKTKKTVRITVIVLLHIIIIAFLIYIWTRIAYSSAKTRTLRNETVASACLEAASGIHTGAESASAASVILIDP
jgi:cytoskeletal protein RodZ